MNLYNFFIKNGIFIILFCSYFSIYNPLLAFYVYLKTFSANYYICFKHLYPKPELYKWKHLIRLTDTGHYANFLFYFNPTFLPICHNVQFIISFGYYFTKFFFNMKDTDDRDNANLISSLQSIHCNINHSIPYLILLYSNCHGIYEFNTKSLLLSYGWCYCWLIFIYIPWRYYTGDCVYSILDPKHTSIKLQFIILLLLHFIIFIGNTFGMITNNIINTNLLRLE